MSVLVIPAQIDRSAPGNDADPSWTATTFCPGEALSGLFASGDDFADARKNVAQLVWDVVQSGSIEDVDPVDIDAIRVMAITRKTFTAEALSGS
jgi:hypothetical protein